MISISKVVLKAKDIQGVVSVLKSGHLVQGPKVHELEKKFARLCRVKYAVAVSNGTAALHTALYACGINPGDEVITTPFTFVATANSILMVGARPVFVDIEEKTFNIDASKIEKAINRKTKAILVVNLFGQPADYNAINKIAKKHKLFVIEDAAQSIGSIYKNKESGNLANVSCFSLYATKNVTSGEGGMLTMNDKKIYERAKLFRQHGEREGMKYSYHGLGFNYRLTDILAAIGLVQIEKIISISKKRQTIAKKYEKTLSNIPSLILPTRANDRTHVYHQFTLRVKSGSKPSRDELQKYLKKQGIQSNIYYPKPLYAFNHISDAINKNTNSAEFPITEKLSKEVLSIPVHQHLTNKEVNYIISTIKNAYI